MDKLREADFVAQSLCGSLMRAGSGLSNVPGLVLRMINEDLWQERIVERTGERVVFTRFEEFVTTPPLEGLGASMELLRRVCSGEAAALDALDRVTQHGEGRPIKTVDDVNGSEDRPVGNSSAAALRRLRKDRPDLHAAVLAGEKTPHGAMVEAGFRPKTITHPLTPESFATAARKHLPPDDLIQLIELLQG